MDFFRKIKRGRGRPPMTWWSNIVRELKKPPPPESSTQDRSTWRRQVRRQPQIMGIGKGAEDLLKTNI